jgi:hypothetical protein
MDEYLPTADQERVLRILVELARRSRSGPPAFGNLLRQLVREGVRDPERLVEGLAPVWVHLDGPLGPSTQVWLTYEGLVAAEPESAVRVLFVDVVRTCYAAYIGHEPATPAVYEPVTILEQALLGPEPDDGTVAILRVLLEVEGICRPVSTADGADRIVEVSERISRLGGVTDPDAYRRAGFRVR